MEKIVEQDLLYDPYGELLTEHQRKMYEDVVLNDLSPSEIAEELGISHQGVHDLIKRYNEVPKEYETKLHLVAKFMKIRDMAGEVKHLTDERARTEDTALIGRIRRLSGEVTDTLQPVAARPLEDIHGF